MGLACLSLPVTDLVEEFVDREHYVFVPRSGGDGGNRWT